MKREKCGKIYLAVCLLAAFGIWTAAVRHVDVRPIGPLGSAVGFASVNGLIHNLTGVHMDMYLLTDWLSLIPAGIVAGFGLLGLAQWIRRRRLLNVDASILLLGGFYLSVMAAFVCFELFVVNYRPVLIDGNLEASYPSSTTMLVMCVIPTAIEQLRRRIGHRGCRRFATTALWVFMCFMVLARLISGVHWFTDIVGGALLSGGLVMLYSGLCDILS